MTITDTTALPAGLDYVEHEDYAIVLHDASQLLVLRLPFPDPRWVHVVAPLLAGPDWTVGKDDIDQATCGKARRQASDAIGALNRRWLDTRDERVSYECIERNRCHHCGGHCAPYPQPGEPACPAQRYAEPLPLDALEQRLGLEPLPFPWPEPAVSA